ncbi:MAG: crossover junction endodeoxyribonuclease RuvC [Actinomycetota bacterium]|jgi:crossover junction endodeoxyribonuclease RuvC|nr:crossover junction endodeoxyribonuclease RuvC [Actinomycetota bacterium]
MFDTCVLGVDPGVARMGLACVARSDRKPVLLWADTVRTPAGMPEAERLAILAAAMRLAISDHHPETVALERVAFNRNTASALQVARATGAVMVVAAEAGLFVGEYAPTEVKNAITGMGNADKGQVREALVRIHGLKSVPDLPDAADAVAIALTHLTGARLRAVSRLGASP